MSDSKYAFEKGRVRLTHRDYQRWREAFPYIDLHAELTGHADWAARQDNWFCAMSQLLVKHNQLARERQTGIRYNGFEGVL